MSDTELFLPAVDDAQLAAVIRAALDEPSATVEDGWTCRPLTGGWGEGVAGIWRLDGSVRVHARRRPWSLVLKSLRRGDGTLAWDDPCREAHAYRSGLLATLPGGLAAPRCFAVEDLPDGTTWLWLEAIDDDSAPWPEEQFPLAAERLGRFNGAFLAGAPLPSAPWLSRDWLRHFVEASGPAVADLPRLTGAGASDVSRRMFPPRRVATLLRLWDERELYLAALDRLPPTLCHHDAFRGNLLGRPGSTTMWPVAIDWAFTGIGAVGEDLVPLVHMALVFEAGREPRRLDAACFAGYVKGLRTAGWEGDEARARLGYTAAATLRYTVGVLRLVLPAVVDPALHVASLEMMGLTEAGYAAALDAFWAYTDELAAEARSLLPLVAGPARPPVRGARGRADD